MQNKFFYIFLFTLIIVSCKSYKEQQDELPDTSYRGTINVSADETFKPIVDELVKVYESNNRDTKINVDYKPEADCLNDLLNDSIRMVIVTRKFSVDERELIIDSLGVGPRTMVVARDGISVIVHPSSTDTMFTMKDIKDILTGKLKNGLIPVFDGVKATSTVRFIIDSVLRGDSLTPKAMAARSSEGVIDFVSKNPGVIGFIGVSWIGNPEDETQLSFLKKVKVANIESTDMPGSYVKAYQANIYLKRYPMVRDLIYILKENHRGLGTGFANFMSGEIGQIIFKRAYLAPAQKNLGIRPVRLNE
ncbi:MAG: substrate-binding domain-containing protein [Chitinophagaceae bacterium]|nr:substrate-binding domain-containing protein [Chitinophagaceae bacterium]MBP7314352.1 substrate-binding domain-containing protein [Chitinophagaceae bacterium]